MENKIKLKYIKGFYILEYNTDTLILKNKELNEILKRL